MDSINSMKSYEKSVEIKANSLGLFKALTERIDEWWGEVDQQPNALEQEFKVSFGEAYWRFKVTTLEVGTRIIWECIESNQVHAGLKGIREEWLGTTLHWEMASIDASHTKLHFRHEGLIPSFNCYEVCADAWSFFIGTSLKQLIEKGLGKPESV